MAPEGGGADQHGVALANGLQQFFCRGEFAVDAFHAHAGAGHTLGQAIGDGRGVAIGAGVEQSHGELGALLGFAPAAVVHHQAAPAFGDRRAVARRDRADRQLIDAIEHRFHLPHHGGHQAVVEVAPVFLGAAAVGLRPGVAAEVSGEELAAHQQTAGLLKRHQTAGPAGRGGGQKLDAVAIRPLQLGLAAHHLQRRQGGQHFRLGRGCGAGR